MDRIEQNVAPFNSNEWQIQYELEKVSVHSYISTVRCSNLYIYVYIDSPPVIRLILLLDISRERARHYSFDKESERERKRKKKRKDFNMKYLFPPRVKRVLNGLPLNNDRVSRQRPASRGRNLRRNTVVEFFPEFTITGIRITWKRAYPSGTAASYNTSAIQSV